ncbi:hypothetical protein JCM19239_6607 [Vibrio variabilis]|uniref:Uncharacterized protein n=1 Tax=Vibrio variabilis TaxID=990271 RepID=A0ABQ0JR47_9VIBR|nr:hypothetical protein JCM19239_6607 [Vibrio variabilis]
MTPTQAFCQPKDALKRFNYSKNTIKHINGDNDQFAYVCLDKQAEMYIKQCQRMLESFGMCLVKRI